MSSASRLPLTLIPFAPSSGGAVRSLEARVERGSEGVLHFQYALDADMGRIRVPERRPSAAANELWKHTCFEAFLAPAVAGAGGGQNEAAIAAYRELNFSPSTEWAVYSFTAYRQGMSAVHMAVPPDIRVEATPSTLEVSATVDARAFLAAPKLRIALSAVIEDDRGGISYWALKHAPARPDFHHPSGFLLEV